MGKFTFMRLAEEVLRKERKPLSVSEIWAKAKELNLIKDLSSTGKTPWRSIGAQIYVDIRDNANTIFYQYSSRPAKFFLKSLKGTISDTEDEYIEDQTEKKTSFHERDLHKLLVKFANIDSHFKAHLKTIYHENSKRKKGGFNEWLHPDLVGVYFPFEKDLEKNALELQKTLSLSSTKLFSFEMKKNLNWSNLRQCYFQAVSNSSWAHEGYLVTFKIDDDSEFIDELRRLNNAFGIGIIKLDAENIAESEILFSAKAKDEIDWDTINRLLANNSDFDEFIQRVTKDANYAEVRKDKYDKVLSDTELEKHIKDKQIF